MLLVRYPWALLQSHFYSVAIWFYFKIFMHQQFSIMVWTAHVIKLPTHLRYFSGLKSVARHNHLYNMIHYTTIYKWFNHTVTKIWWLHDHKMLYMSILIHIFTHLPVCMYIYVFSTLFISVYDHLLLCSCQLVSDASWKEILHV